MLTIGCSHSDGESYALISVCGENARVVLDVFVGVVTGELDRISLLDLAHCATDLKGLDFVRAGTKGRHVVRMSALPMSRGRSLRYLAQSSGNG